MPKLTQEKPLTFTVGGLSFDVRDMDNELTAAETKIALKILSPIMGKSADNYAELLAELDVAAILALLCKRANAAKWNYKEYDFYRDLFNDNPIPEEAGEVIRRFFGFIPGLMQKYSRIYSGIAAR